MSHFLGRSLAFHRLKKRCDLFWKGLFTHRPITIVVRPSSVDLEANEEDDDDGISCCCACMEEDTVWISKNESATQII